jgi:quinol monooxygenase YgiN
MIKDNLEAVAAVRTALVTGARQLPGARVMSGRFMTIPQAAGVPQGRPNAARYLSNFIEEMKSTGFVAAALQRHGLGPDDAVVAPPAAALLTTVQVAAYIEVQTNAAQPAEQLIGEYVRGARKDPANVALQAFQETGRPTRWVIISSWRDRAAFTEHETGMAAKTLKQQLQALLRAPIDQRIHATFAAGANRSGSAAAEVHTVTHVDVPGAMREQAEQLLRTLRAASAAEAGNLRYDVYQQDAPRPNHFTVAAAWRNARDFAAHGQSAHQLQFRQALGPLLGALYDERVYRLVKF